MKEKQLRIKFQSSLIFPLSDDIKKLKGYHNVYRLRIGDYRIVFGNDATSWKIQIPHQQWYITTSYSNIHKGRKND